MKPELRKSAMLVAVLIVCIIVIVCSALSMLRKSTGNNEHTGTDPRKESSSGDTDGKREDDMDITNLTTAVADRLCARDRTHGLKLSENSAVTRLTATTGTLSEEYDVITFSGKGASAEWVMDLSSPVSDDQNEPIILSVKEIHRENEETLAYTVYVNDQTVYFRTYTQLASAPNRYYILLKRDSVADLSRVTIRIESECKTEFSIAEITAYTDLFAAAKREGLDTGLGIYLHSASSVDKAKTHLSDFAGYDYRLYNLGLLFKLDYMNLTPDAAVTALTDYLAIASKNNVNLQIMPTLYWGQPNLPDGKGGMFTDSKYQQITYNSLLDRYFGTNPNVYSSTTWVTSASEVLNNACAAKIETVFSRFSGLLNQYRASGQYSNRVSIVMEHGVCYKGQSTSTGEAFSFMDCADFGPLMIALAKADGVVLDPTDGLSREEKLWMIKHHADYNQTLADAYRRAFGSDPVISGTDGIIFPDSQVSDNIFTHGVQWTERSPANSDDLVSGWKSGIGRGMYSSSEDMYWDDVRFYQYKASYGRVGTVNFEVSYSKSRDLYDLLRKGYELGFEFITLFNDDSSYNTAEILKELDEIDSEISDYTVNHYDRALLSADFNRDTAITDWMERYGAAEISGLVYDTENGVLKSENPALGGYIVFRISDDGDIFENGLRIWTESKGAIELSAGTSPAALVKIGKLKTVGGINYVNSFIGSSFEIKSASGHDEYFIRLDLSSSATLKAVDVFTVFGKMSGQLNGVTTTRKEQRILSLWTQKERLSENLLQTYLEKRDGNRSKTVEDAEILIDRGLYISAYKRISSGLSEALPATYVVKGKSKLGDLPITVSTGVSYYGQITVLSLSDNSAEMSFFSNYQYNEKARQLTVTFSGLDDGRYSFRETSFNRYTLEKDKNGEYTAKDGSLSVTVQVKFGSGDRKYTTVSGRVTDIKGSLVTMTVQNPEISLWSRSVTFELAENCVMQRSADGTSTSANEAPHKNDYLVLVFDQSGEKAVQATATYGKTEGTVAEYIPPDYSDPDTPNGLVKLTDGRIFEIEYLDYSTQLVYNNSGRNVRTYSDTELGNILSGHSVTIEYCPEYYGEYQRIMKITVG